MIEKNDHDNKDERGDRNHNESNGNIYKKIFSKQGDRDSNASINTPKIINLKGQKQRI